MRIRPFGSHTPESRATPTAPPLTFSPHRHTPTTHAMPPSLAAIHLKERMRRIRLEPHGQCWSNSAPDAHPTACRHGRTCIVRVEQVADGNPRGRSYPVFNPCNVSICRSALARVTLSRFCNVPASCPNISACWVARSCAEVVAVPLSREGLHAPVALRISGSRFRGAGELKRQESSSYCIRGPVWATPRAWHPLAGQR